MLMHGLIVILTDMFILNDNPGSPQWTCIALSKTRSFPIPLFGMQSQPHEFSVLSEEGKPLLGTVTPVHNPLSEILCTWKFSSAEG